MTTEDHTTAALNAEVARRERAENELAHARELLERHASDAGWPLKAEIERRERAEYALKRAQEALAFSQQMQAACEKLMGDMREGLARLAAGKPLHDDERDDEKDELIEQLSSDRDNLHRLVDAEIARRRDAEDAGDEACAILRPVSGVAGVGPPALVASAKSAVDRWNKTTKKLQSVADRQRAIIDNRGTVTLRDIDGVYIGRATWEWKDGEPALVFPKRYVEHPVRDAEPARPQHTEQARPSYDPSKPDLWLAVCAYAERARLDQRLIQVMRQRRQLGIERYGTPLQPLNGRDAARDLREELLDAVVYAAQVAIEARGGDAVTTATGAVLALTSSGAFQRVLDLACSVVAGQERNGGDVRALAERCVAAEAKLQALREQVARGTASGDRCQFCLGAKGGEPGREQTVGGALACAECAELVQAAVENAQVWAADVTDSDAAELAAMFRATSASAAEIARQEATGELVGLVTPVGGTVTDPDEIEMHRRLAEQNIAICATCRNTGWGQGGKDHCECPYGWFLAKKTTTKE